MSSTNNLLSDHKKLIAIIVGIFVILSVLLLFLTKKTPSLNKNTTSKTTTYTNVVLKDTKPYTDTGNYYRITMPKTWTTSESTSKGTTGLNTGHPVTHQTEITQFYLPNDIGVTIQIDKTTPTCPLNLTLDTTIAGFPAAYYPAQHMWEIPTKSAMIAINVTYPGSNGSHGFMRTILTPTPTPIPASQIKNDQDFLNAVVNTLKFTNLQPLSC